MFKKITSFKGIALFIGVGMLSISGAMADDYSGADGSYVKPVRQIVSKAFAPVRDGTGRFSSVTVFSTQSRVLISAFGDRAENNSSLTAEEMTVVIPGGDKLVFTKQDGTLKSGRANTRGDWKIEGTLKVTEGSYRVVFFERSRNEFESTESSALIQFLPNDKSEGRSELSVR